MTVYSAKKIIRESMPILSVLIIIECFGGQMLNSKLEYLAKLPILLMMIPLINGLGGNIGSALSARISSGLHVGYIEPKLGGARLKENIFASLILGIAVFVSFGLFMCAISPFLGKGSIQPLNILIIMVGAGLMLVGISIALSLITSLISFKKGIDPDNVVIPILTTCVDISGISCLLFMIWLVGV